MHALVARIVLRMRYNHERCKLKPNTRVQKYCAIYLPQVEPIHDMLVQRMSISSSPLKERSMTELNV